MVSKPAAARTKKLVGAIGLLVLFSPTVCLASPYGRNGYSSCRYTEDCSGTTQTTEQQIPLRNQLTQTISTEWSKVTEAAANIQRASSQYLPTPLKSPQGATLLGSLLFTLFALMLILIRRRRKDTADEDTKLYS